MVYQVGNRSYCVVSQVFTGITNEVAVCRRDSRYTTLWMVKDHRTVRSLISLFAGCTGGTDGDYLGGSACGENFFFLFRYRQERPAKLYFQGETRTLQECGELALNIIMECTLADWLPMPLLCLILTQDKVNIGRDGQVYLTYGLDLQSLDETVGERECACACALLTAELLGQRKDGAENSSLIQRKAGRGAYTCFHEVYRDIKLLCRPQEKPGVAVRIWAWTGKKKKKLTGILLAVCLILVLAALVILLSLVFTGDVALFRILHRTFDQIGTESLR